MLFVCYIDLESNNLLDCFIVSNASSILLDFLHGQLYHLQIKFSFFFFPLLTLLLPLYAYLNNIV